MKRLKVKEFMCQEDTSLLPLGGSSMPEVVFAHFHNKFGSKAIVDDYIGSLNNTLLQFEKVRGPHPARRSAMPKKSPHCKNPYHAQEINRFCSVGSHWTPDCLSSNLRKFIEHKL